MSRSAKTAFAAAALCICLSCAQVPSVRTEIHSRRAGFAANSVDAATDDADSLEQSPPPAPSGAPSSVINTDFVDKMSWKCANNASCLYALAASVLHAYRRGETVKLGLFDVVKLPASSKSKFKLNFKGQTESGRGMSSFVDFVSGNSVRIPVGPMVFSVQRDEDDGNYIEIALLKKAAAQGRRGGDDDDGGGLLGSIGSGGGGGLLSGGGGGGLGGGGGSGFGGGGGGNGNGGGGGGHGGIRHRHKDKEDKKQFQMFIPMYLAATTFGWTMVAAKAVGLLTLKALAISKLAFVVAAMVIVKKLMDNASEKMMYQYPEHSPYMMPYNMDYPMHAMGGPEMATGDMYPAALHLAAAAGHQGHPGLDGLAAESNFHHNFAEAQNNTNVLAALNAVGLGQKVKREDSWLAKSWRFPLHAPKDNASMSLIKINNSIGQTLALAAAAAVAQEEEDAAEAEDDDIFNEEETAAARRPLVYNYVQPHHPYYRA